MNEKPLRGPFDLATDERRQAPRIGVEHEVDPGTDSAAQELGRIVTAKLIDLSEGGIGVETTAPLPSGQKVSIAGELHSTRFCIGFEGCARVAYCRPLPSGTFRIGLAFTGATCRNLLCDHELGSWEKPVRTVPVAGTLRGAGKAEVRVPSRVWGWLQVKLPQTMNGTS